MQTSSSSIWHWLMRVMDFLTGPTFGVLVAVTVIVFLHFKPSIISFCSNLVENGVQETLLECLLGLCDLARAYYQIACEFIRSFGAPGSSGETSSAVRLINTSATSRASRGSFPPPLVMEPLENDVILPSVPLMGSSTTQGQPVDGPSSPSGSSSSSTTQNAATFRQEIEPAFLDERDYPPGWLVYHSTLGVTSKEEADRFDRKMTAYTSG